MTQKHSSIQDTANATRIIISELYNKGNIKTYILTDLRVAKDIQSRRARKTWSYLFPALDDDLFKSKGNYFGSLSNRVDRSQL